MRTSSDETNGRSPAKRHTMKGATFVVLLGIAAVGSGIFGYVMVDQFRTTTAVWVPASVEMRAGDSIRGEFPRDVTTRMVLEVAAGDSARVVFEVPADAPFAHVYALATSMEREEPVIALRAADVGLAGEVGAAMSDVAVSDVAVSDVAVSGVAVSGVAVSDGRGWAAGLDPGRAWVQAPPEAMATFPEGMRLLVVASVEALPDAAVRGWQHTLPALDDHEHGSVVWTRVEFRVDPTLQTAAASRESAARSSNPSIHPEAGP